MTKYDCIFNLQADDTKSEATQLILRKLIAAIDNKPCETHPEFISNLSVKIENGKIFYAADGFCCRPYESEILLALSKAFD